MVKVRGPNMAVSAAGGLGDVLTFSQSKGRAYVKKWSKPKNPRTRPQIATRAIMAFLASDWRNLAQAVRDAWIPAAEIRNISPYNAFLSFNLARWRNHKAPSWIESAIELGPHCVWSGMTTTGGRGSIRFHGTITSQHAGWPIFCYWLPSYGFPIAWHMLILAFPTIPSGYFHHTLHGLAPGSYKLAYGKGNNTGGLWPSQKNVSTVVT